MSHIDEELAKTLQEEDGNEAPALSRPAVSHPAAKAALPDHEGRKRNLLLLGVLVAIAAAIGALVLFSFQDAAVYAKSVDQLVASKDQLVGRRVRVEGVLVHGSLLKRDSPCEYRFKLQNNGATIDVRYPQCVVPDTFRDRPETDVGVTAEGELARDGSFEATQIMAKCPSKYEERNGKMVPVGTVEASR